MRGGCASCFVQLVLFAQKDAPQLYEHFLLLEELADAAGFNRDLEEFHGARSEWVDETIKANLDAIRVLEARVNADDAWYGGRRPARAKDVQHALASASSRLKRAMPRMTAFERLAMGSTYREAFGHPSETIHDRAGADPVDHSRESTVEAEGTKLGQLALCVLRRILAGNVALLQDIARLGIEYDAHFRAKAMCVRNDFPPNELDLPLGHITVPPPPSKEQPSPD